jgi:hypothetical protein
MSLLGCIDASLNGLGKVVLVLVRVKRVGMGEEKWFLLVFVFV